jgi:hypothetical protein
MKSIYDMTQEELENIELLGLDDTFPFACKTDCGEVCGKCCKNREDILLTGWDVFRLAHHFKCSNWEFIDKYCEVYPGSESKLPVVRLIPKPYQKTCVFLHKGLCSLHHTKAKPGLCRSYPLAKVTIPNGKSGFHLNFVPDCGVKGGTSVVRDWVGDIASDEHVESSEAWAEMLCKITPILQKYSKSKSPDAFLPIFKTAFEFMYTMYAGWGFAEQCRDNTEVFCANVGKL